MRRSDIAIAFNTRLVGDSICLLLKIRIIMILDNNVTTKISGMIYLKNTVIYKIFSHIFWKNVQRIKEFIEWQVSDINMSNANLLESSVYNSSFCFSFLFYAYIILWFQMIIVSLLFKVVKDGNKCLSYIYKLFRNILPGD